MTNGGYMEVVLSDGSVLNYSIHGDINDANEEYFVIRKGSGSIVGLLDDFNLSVSRKVEGTSYYVDYIRTNLDKNTKWKEPLCKKFTKQMELEDLFPEGAIIVEINNQCCPRDDYNETDKPWIYFGIYGVDVFDGFTKSDMSELSCDLAREIFINAMCHFSDSNFKCSAAVSDVCDWFQEITNIKAYDICSILRVIDQITLENKGVCDVT